MDAHEHADEPLPAATSDAAAIARASTCFNFLRSVPILFEIDDAALWDIARSAELVQFEPRTHIVSEGDESAKRFYVIRRGSADVIRRDRSGTMRTVARLSVGSYFGELGLLTDQARNATVRVHGSTPLEVYAFDALTFHRRIAQHVLAFRLLSAPSSARADDVDHGRGPEGRHAPAVHIRDLDLFDHLPAHDLDFVTASAEHRWHACGTTIIQQGAPGDRFYVLLEGAVTVRRDNKLTAKLTTGDFFGETALLLDMPRTASVIADGDALTWSISRGAFQRLVGSYLMSNPRTQEEIMRRMAETLPLGGADEAQ